VRIALIEDNQALANGIAHCLRDAGHAVDLIADGGSADEFLSSEGADLVILDVNLPGMNGVDVLRNLRRRKDATPVILLTARGAVENRVEGLDAGADDYLVKPFEMVELEARIRALLRRPKDAVARVVRIGSLDYAPETNELVHDGVQLDLPRKERAVFECLYRHRSRLASKTVLLDHVYGVGAEVEDKVIEVLISRLRKRIARYDLSIRTARGLGYRLEETDPQ